MRWHKLHMPAVPFALFLVLLKAVACDGLKAVAVRDLEAGSRQVAVAPSTPVPVPVIAIGLQLVGLNVKPGTVDVYVDVPD